MRARLPQRARLPGGRSGVDYGRRVTPPSTAPQTSIVVVTWNGAALLPSCLDSLLAQDGAQPEIVVVDNGSTDGTLQLLSAEYPRVRVVALPRNLGFTGGANAGIAAARGEFIGLLNNDAVAGPGFVAAAAAALVANPGLGAVTGLILLDGGYAPAPSGTGAALVAADGTTWVRSAAGTTLVNSTGGEVTRSANGRDRDWLTPADELSRPPGAVAAFSGGAVLLRRAALEAVGTFDERLFMYYEDSDLSWRLRRSGWPIGFEPGAVVVHQHAASSGTETDFFLFHNERNRLLFALKHGPASVIASAYGRTVVAIVRALLRGAPRAAARKLRALGSSLALAPRYLADRRAIDRAATVSRAAVWAGAPRR